MSLTFLEILFDLTVCTIGEHALNGFDISIEAQIQLFPKAMQKEG
jgi:hypothetical protein